MEKASTSETLGTANGTARYQYPEDHSLNIHCHENLKSHQPLIHRELHLSTPLPNIK
jgi:hypothetical protein